MTGPTERRAMNDSEVLLLQRLATRDVEVERLLSRHRAFEERLAQLDRHRWLSSDERREMAELKRRKLAGRDRMQQILRASA